MSVNDKTPLPDVEVSSCEDGSVVLALSQKAQKTLSIALKLAAANDSRWELLNEEEQEILAEILDPLDWP